jgi:hypothetical protein
MAYQNINFPTLKLIHDFQEEKLAPTTVVSNFAKEYRINRFTSPRRVFTFPARNMTYADWTVINNFVISVGFSRDSFNFTHPITGNVIKVRFDSIPSASIVSLNSNNAPVIVNASDIVLIEVFNE